jgi:tetratricopeptide (TPR) repeat protein
MMTSLLSLGVLVLAAPSMAQLAPAAPAVAPAAAPDLKPIARMIEKGQLALAERQLRQILAQGGGPAARDLLGVVFVRKGQVEEAERQFREALAANPALVSARQHLARLYVDQGREAEALVELRRAAQQGPLERDLGLRLARAELAAGNPALAERQLNSVAERFKSVQALLELARLQSRQKNAPAALGTLKKALAIAPSSEEVLHAYAQVALAGHQPVQALQALEPLARLCPSVMQYHYLLGVAMMQAGDMVSAVEALKRAEQLEPNRTLTLIALGLALNAQKLYGEAKPYLVRTLELEPDSVEAVSALSESEEGLGELQSAEAHAQRALSRSSGDAIANMVLGMVRMKQERYAEALEALNRAVAAAPSSPKAHYQLSLAYARLGDRASSEKYLRLYQEKVREIDDRVKEIHAQTGMSSGGMGK